ncbi:MAG TPA: ester cyclase [Ktedonobacterales bacterium]|nr:ester cyclase [Ktedonobacterales bacterium]
MATLDSSIAQQSHNQEVFRRLIAVGFSGGDLSVVDDVCSPDFVEHPAGVHPANREGVKRLITYLHQALPDLTCAIEEMVASGDTVWARVRARGTHRGTFMGVAPTGRMVTVDIVDVSRFDGGKIVEHWGISDRLATLEQLGSGRSLPQASE